MNFREMNWKHRYNSILIAFIRSSCLNIMVFWWNNNGMGNWKSALQIEKVKKVWQRVWSERKTKTKRKRNVLHEKLQKNIVKSHKYLHIKFHADICRVCSIIKWSISLSFSHRFWMSKYEYERKIVKKICYNLFFFASILVFRQHFVLQAQAFSSLSFFS